jgi:hypothetical protein
MLPKKKDLILKERVELYNNLAQIDKCSGRLSVDLELYPLPRIVWEFEILGEANCGLHKNLGTDDPLSPFIGHWFSIEKPLLSGLADNSTGPRSVYRGTTVQADFGDLDEPAHFFRLYLPNTRFQEENVIGQESIIKRIEEGGRLPIWC